MSDRQSSSKALDALLVEAREHLRPAEPAADEANQEWQRLEAKILAAATRVEPVGTTPIAPSRRRDVLVRAGVVALAAAAALVIVRRDTPGPDPVIGAAVVSERAAASSLRSTERAGRTDGAGEIRIGGAVATAGHVLRADDTVEAAGARAIFERPRKVTWLVEQDGTAAAAPARVRVKSAGEPLVLALESGVIEAQVVPVASGEAFAVDVAAEPAGDRLVRIAVHGTHLRVARSGNHVVVDLTEGVVSIGVPPRTGVTYGTLVTAPAHVELDASDPASVRVDHAPSSVRAPVPLPTAAPVALGAAAPAAADPAALLPDPAPAGAVGKATAPADGIVPRFTAPPRTPGKIEPPRPSIAPRAAIAAAVRECAAARSRPGQVHVTVSSDLRLRVSEGGVVETAQFSPPLLPEIQSCAAEAIYRTKLDETGLVTVPIEFSY
jgi:hypothetical protein